MDLDLNPIFIFIALFLIVFGNLEINACLACLAVIIVCKR